MKLTGLFVNAAINYPKIKGMIEEAKLNLPMGWSVRIEKSEIETCGFAVPDDKVIYLNPYNLYATWHSGEWELTMPRYVREHITSIKEFSRYIAYHECGHANYFEHHGVGEGEMEEYSEILMTGYYKYASLLDGVDGDTTVEEFRHLIRENESMAEEYLRPYFNHKWEIYANDYALERMGKNLAKASGYSLFR